MTQIEKTALARLEREGRLLNAVLKGTTTVPGRFGFRGDIALKFQAQVADEKRPPDFSIEQVLTFANENEPTLPILAGYLHNFAYLETAAEVLGDLLTPTGAYFMFCNNIDLLSKFRVKIGEITFNILPCDESTVWKEMMDLHGVDKNDIKKLDTAGKTDYLLDAALRFNDAFEVIAYRQGVERMEPVKNRNENRPV
jgi:hypothetical protein